MSIIIQPKGHRVTRVLTCKIKDGVRRNKHGDAMLGSRTKSFKIDGCMIFNGNGKPVEGQTVRRANLETGRGQWGEYTVEAFGKVDSNGYTKVWKVI